MGPDPVQAGVATAEPATTARLNGTSVTAAASGLSCRVPCKYKAARVMAELVAAVFRNAPMVPWRSSGNRRTAGAARRGGPAVGDEERGGQRRCQPGDRQGWRGCLGRALTPHSAKSGESRTPGLCPV